MANARCALPKSNASVASTVSCTRRTVQLHVGGTLKDARSVTGEYLHLQAAKSALNDAYTSWPTSFKL